MGQIDAASFGGGGAITFGSTFLPDAFLTLQGRHQTVIAAGYDKVFQEVLVSPKLRMDRLCMTKTQVEGDTHLSVPPARPAGTTIRQPVSRSVKQLYGKMLKTSEGDIGPVKDIYFDDQQWVIRYIVADTGSWLSSRLILLSPHALKDFDSEESDNLLVNLSRQQIENSPAIDTHKPVSRQFEEEYYRYYAWPTYWAGGGLWGMGGYPMIPPHVSVPAQEGNPGGDFVNHDDLHLRRASEIEGYHIHASDGAIGRVTDLLIAEKSWAIHQLIVETGHWYAGKKIAIPTTQIDRISYEDSTVFVKVTKESIQATPEDHAH